MGVRSRVAANRTVDWSRWEISLPHAQSDDEEPTLDGSVAALKGVFDKFGMHS